MSTHPLSFHVCDRCLGRETLSCMLFWNDLHDWLKPYVLKCLYQYNVPLWLGQEQDIANDVLQETFMRILKYMQREALTSNRPIESLESFCKTVARNYILDMWRKEHRLVSLTTLCESSDGKRLALYATDPVELALSHLMSRDTLLSLAQLIINFPPGQRRALLIDLAQRSDFNEETGSLHIIFLELGINLHEYRCADPFSAIERSRHNALLSIAYKRLKKQFWAQAGNLVA